MRVLFFPCTMDGLPKHTGSRLLRCEWMAEAWEGAEVYDGTQRLKDFQLFVFQKAYLSGQSQKLIAKLARMRDTGKWKGIKLAFDLCDPDFLGDKHRERMLAVLPLFDFAVAPTKLLADWLAQYVPAYVVPDGVKLTAIPARPYRPTNAPPTIVWMGYKGNMAVLSELADKMTALGVTGDIVALDAPMPFETFVAQMQEYDIVLNPRSDYPPFCYKSDNKTLVAWAAGCAVARTPHELEQLLTSAIYRTEHIQLGREYVEEVGTVAVSVDCWRDVCVQEGLLQAMAQPVLG